MLREPRKTQQTQAQPAQPARKKGRFQLEKLEERIAPTLHTNPHGKTVGNDGNGHGGGIGK